MTAPLLTGFRLRAIERHLGVYGIHVHREGHEPVAHRFRADDLVNVYSCSKTVTSLAVGIAVGDGLLGLDDRLVDHLDAPPGEVADGVDRITVRHLLQMTDGSSFTCSEPPQTTEPDRAGAYLAAELVREPGDRFEYSNGASYMLGRLVSLAGGTELRDYLLPRLFDPLGITNPQWFRCPRGFSAAASGLHLRTSELAAVGRLLLQDGAWDGDQLVPADHVRAMREDVVDTTHAGDEPDWQAGYGYQVWRCDQSGAWRADGKYGQFAVVLPDQRAVVTITAHNEVATHEILTAVWQEILPRL